MQLTGAFVERAGERHAPLARVRRPRLFGERSQPPRGLVQAEDGRLREFDVVHLVPRCPDDPRSP